MTQGEYEAIRDAHNLWQADPATGTRADFTGLSLHGLDLADDNLSDCVMGDCDLGEATMNRSVVQRVDFSAANFLHISPGGQATGGFTSCDFTGSNLKGVDLTFGYLENAVFDECILQGAIFSTGFLAGASFVAANLKDADISGFINATGADFTRANLSGADMSDGTYDESNFEGATLTNANLSDASFYACNFLSAGLTGLTVTSRTDLVGSDLIACRYNLPEILPPLGYGRSFLHRMNADYTRSNVITKQEIFEETATWFTELAADATYQFELMFFITCGTLSTRLFLDLNGNSVCTFSAISLSAITAAPTGFDDFTDAVWSSAITAGGEVRLSTGQTGGYFSCHARGVISTGKFGGGLFRPCFRFNNLPGGVIKVKAGSFMSFAIMGNSDLAARRD